MHPKLYNVTTHPKLYVPKADKKKKSCKRTISKPKIVDLKNKHVLRSIYLVYHINHLLIYLNSFKLLDERNPRSVQNTTCEVCHKLEWNRVR